ncbi:Isocitrate dehydrogenase regulatory subunit 2 [Hibiscus syriacus]|uniref:Isocitrate dehydrogenase regulatory subunit 2 n=1 Tax=Hibiscus syriacus TaxID=106335 RepID=A0A6A3B9E2_HIBSY|nr:Isocitrate dehydrogenase regulatory subunit 2 [Hibiscus syriacus]
MVVLVGCQHDNWNTIILTLISKLRDPKNGHVTTIPSSSENTYSRKNPNPNCDQHAPAGRWCPETRDSYPRRRDRAVGDERGEQVMEAMHDPVYLEKYEVHGDMKQYPGIKYDEIFVDNCCMHLVSRPEQFDVMLCYFSGVQPSCSCLGYYQSLWKFCCKYSSRRYWCQAWSVANVGAEYAVFEQGASAGNVGNEKIVSQKTANPVALLLSSAMMLRHLQFPSFADRLENAVKRVILEGRYRTEDLGGDSTNQEVN